MLTSAQIKWIRSLHQKKNRETEKLFLVEGEKLHQELFKSDFQIVKTYATTEWLEQNQTRYSNFEFQNINGSQLERISVFKTPNKILSIVKIRNWPPNLLAASLTELTLVLDNISDPGNLGTIIRTANWFGVKNIVCSTESVETFNPKVVQASMGSVFSTPVFHQNLDAYLSLYSNLEIHGAMLDGQSLYSQPLTLPSILILGNESRGISPHLKKYLTKKISIPPFGQAESLNITVACGIFCAFYKKEIS